MNIYAILSLCAFFVATSIHLYASAKQDQKLRNLTKPFILLSLLGLYLAMARPILLLMVLALIFSWLGDVFLMIKSLKWFAVGGVCFLVSHIFFVLAYNTQIDFTLIPLWAIILLGAFFLAAVVIIFIQLKPHLPHALFYPMALYLATNGAMNCFAIFRAISNPGLASVITVIGAFLFFISDTTLFFVRFNKESRMKSHFLIMLTYSVGELLIVLGMIYL